MTALRFHIVSSKATMRQTFCCFGGRSRAMQRTTEAPGFQTFMGCTIIIPTFLNGISATAKTFLSHPTYVPEC